MNMSIAQRRPSALQHDFQDFIDRFFGDADLTRSADVRSQWAPRVDIREQQDGFVILADVPGVDPKDIEINMEKGVLTIRGERQVDKSEEEGKYTRIERSRGVFYRRFALPDSADAEGIKAKGRHGVLEITIPRTPESTPRRIAVDSGE